MSPPMPNRPPGRGALSDPILAASYATNPFPSGRSPPDVDTGPAQAHNALGGQFDAAPPCSAGQLLRSDDSLSACTFDTRPAQAHNAVVEPPSQKGTSWAFWTAYSGP
jgi:hypothetical protein